MIQAPNLARIKFYACDYKESIELPYDGGMVIYCDPPYQGTKQYANASTFDYDEFWQIMRQWSKYNIVLISEQKAPDDFECIWEQNVIRSIKVTDKSKATEKLFKWKGNI